MIQRYVTKFRLLVDILLEPHRKNAFLWKLQNKENIMLLDIGCGNQSPEKAKMLRDKIHYVGLDVGDYNQTKQSKQFADEYYVVASDQFAAKIEEYYHQFDAVVCAHNLEHCDEPQRILIAMAKALKSGGKLFLNFPSEESVNFPSRRGTLNFYDDTTHQNVPDWGKTLKTLSSQGMEIVFKAKHYRPFFMCLFGGVIEPWSRWKKKIYPGTWAYWGFESVIWAVKK